MCVNKTCYRLRIEINRLPLVIFRLKLFFILSLFIFSDYPKMSLENIQFISSSLISILVPKEVHHDPLPLSFLARFGVQLGTTTETPQSLLNICFLGMLSSFHFWSMFFFIPLFFYITNLSVMVVGYRRLLFHRNKCIFEMKFSRQLF